VKVLLLVLAVFLAYVAGRAVGILLDLNPYVTEAVAIAAVLAILAVRAARR
jgi:hypothetical protein